jgi:hypothetical protein
VLGRVVIAAVVLVQAASLAAADHQHRWLRYANARFGTVAEYPVDLFTRAQHSDNGDGVRWSARDGATLAVWGSWNALEHTPVSYAEFLRRSDRARYARLSYRLVRPKLLILSGSTGERVLYERYAFGDRSGAIHALVLEYPLARQATYRPLVSRISRSLAWSRPAG